ncbi:hypothetical protein DP116_23070 [Brasilonema bromeliae SPC951]|uniref:Uncharacterized protein n=1 Tax=Brasilonema bromeliae SPC951 TaxID=385972 RepID=A0ABX1PEG6_9CYAN|nr:hypothetical protein [Brasilonema bromeliae SPC951]
MAQNVYYQRNRLYINSHSIMRRRLNLKIFFKIRIKKFIKLEYFLTHLKPLFFIYLLLNTRPDLFDCTCISEAIGIKKEQ